MARKPDVVIVGAGVMGCSAAYWLSKEGYKVLVLEKDAVAAGASDMSPAMLEPAGPSAWEAQEDELSELFCLGFRLHQELACVLPQESGIDIGHRETPTIVLAFSAEDVESLKPQASALGHNDPSTRWLEGQALREVELRLNRDIVGGLVYHSAQVMAYRFVLALVEAAERQGMELRHGEVVGLRAAADG